MGILEWDPGAAAVHQRAQLRGSVREAASLCVSKLVKNL